ncbi:MAG: DUF4340 domain-containing protein [Thermoanaerobaculia bacterium]
MSSRKILVLTGLVLLLFAFIVFFERKMPTTSEAAQKKELLWDLPVDQVETLRLEHSGSPAVELKRTGPAAWRLVHPESYPADATASADVAAQLARPHRAGSESAEARPEDYGLAAPTTKATIVWKDPKSAGKSQSRTIEFGVDIPGTDAVAARASGSPHVFFLSSAVAAAARKSGADLRSKDVFGGSGPEVAKIDIERGRGRVALARKSGAWWLNQPVVDLADGDFSQRFADELTNLKALEFVGSGERQNLEALGLAPPLYRVTLADAKTATSVDFGATRSDGNTVYARRETQVFLVPSSIVEDLSREAVVFREPRLVRFDRATLSAIEVSFGPERYSFSKKDAGWISGTKTVTAAAADDLMTALLDLKSRSFIDETAAAAFASRTPDATLTAKLGAANAWTIRLFTTRADTEALVSSRPGAFALAGDAVGRLREAFKKAASGK